jgi:hypothetical protein
MQNLDVIKQRDIEQRFTRQVQLPVLDFDRHYLENNFYIQGVLGSNLSWFTCYSD